MAANDIHTKCIDTIRVLAADVVQKSNSGHPGMPMGCAPVAHVLFTEHLNADPSHPAWINRDRFVLSNGHGCALQYIIMHLLGYAITMDDLKQFRQVGSKTPGHPEANHGIPGIEVTTGPLGQGISNAVGLAIAGQHMAATFNKPGYSLFDGKVFCFLGDGCMQEGVASEACSLAGHLGLGNLIAIYDDNHIQIDGDTELGFTEDVVARFKSYNWHTIVVADGDHDLAGISQAIAEAKKVTDKPTLIKVRTTIGFGSLKQGEEAVHGAALGDADVAQVKKKFGFDPEVKFHVDDAVYKHYHDVAARGRAAREAWQTQLERYSQSHPQEHAELSRRLAQKLPDGWAAKLPTVTAKDGAIATRKASEKVLNAICDVLPEIIGGSADLTPSTLTRWKSAVDFQKTGSKIGGPHGRYLRFGVREHGMMAICNGIHAYGGLIPFGSTFFNFISYGAGALRLSALTGHQVLYIMTHDSIGLGEDG
ncbi:transketolase, partial [Caulochytrium protostelioides]